MWDHCALASRLRRPFGDYQERPVGVVAEPLRCAAEVAPAEPRRAVPADDDQVSIRRARRGEDRDPRAPPHPDAALGELRDEGKIFVYRHGTGFKHLDFNNRDSWS